jgi:hypothetical protein
MCQICFEIFVTSSTHPSKSRRVHLHFTYKCLSIFFKFDLKQTYTTFFAFREQLLRWWTNEVAIFVVRLIVVWKVVSWPAGGWQIGWIDLATGRGSPHSQTVPLQPKHSPRQHNHSSFMKEPLRFSFNLILPAWICAQELVFLGGKSSDFVLPRSGLCQIWV